MSNIIQIKRMRINSALIFFEREGITIKDENINWAIKAIEEKYQFKKPLNVKSNIEKYRMFLDASKTLKAAKKEGILLDAIEIREKNKKEKLDKRREEQEKLEKERREKEEQERKEKEEQERLEKERKEKEEQERKAREEQERLEKERKEKEEQERKAREEQERLEKERKEREEQERKAREEQTRLREEENRRKKEQEREYRRKASNKIFKRKDEFYGESLIEISEMDSATESATMEIGDQKIDLKFLKLDPERPGIKPYVITEKFEGIGLAYVDIVYGRINVSGMNFSDDLRSLYLDHILTRENLNIISGKNFGALPYVYLDENNRIKIVDVDKEDALAIANAVLDNAHKQKRSESTKFRKSFSSKLGGVLKEVSDYGTRNVKSEKEEDKKSVFTKLKDYGTRNVKTDNPFEEPAPEKKKGVFSKFFKGREESEEIIEPEAQEPAVENDDFETFRFCNKVIFYKAGICIIGNNILTKYNYHIRDEETSEKGIEGSFLVSNVDDERLKTDSEYMKKFVEEICKPARLKAVRDKQFQYIGGFNKDDEFEVDNNIALDVIKLREKYNEYMEAKNR